MLVARRCFCRLSQHQAHDQSDSQKPHRHEARQPADKQVLREGQGVAVDLICSDQLDFRSDRRAIEHLFDVLIVKPDTAVRRAATDLARVVGTMNPVVLPR